TGQTQSAVSTIQKTPGKNGSAFSFMTKTPAPSTWHLSRGTQRLSTQHCCRRADRLGISIRHPKDPAPASIVRRMAANIGSNSPDTDCLRQNWAAWASRLLPAIQNAFILLWMRRRADSTAPMILEKFGSVFRKTSESGDADGISA